MTVQKTSTHHTMEALRILSPIIEAKAIEIALAEQANEQPLISAEEARNLHESGQFVEMLMSGETKWMQCTSTNSWVDDFYGRKIQFRAIKQPEPVEDDAGFLKRFKENIKADVDRSLAPEPVEPHAELKAMYEQQVKNTAEGKAGGLEDFVWEFYSDRYAKWDTEEPEFHGDLQYRCTPKPTCQIGNLDTGELKTMTREAAKKLQAETKDVCDWFYDGMVANEHTLLFTETGIYTYKLRCAVKLTIDDEPAKMLTQDSLKEMLKYNPDTGVFTWLKPAAYRTKVGEIAGSDHSKGYRVIQLFGKSQKSHRLAWLYMTGAFPKNQIDHINGIKNDNRWLNLREATNAQNQWNKPKSPKNTSGFKGVSWCKVKQKWLVQARLNGKGKHIGYFDDIDMAFAAYGKWASAFHGDFANNGLSKGYGYPEQKGGC